MILQEMVVTDSEGKIKTADGEELAGQCIHAEDIYTFYAVKNVTGLSQTAAHVKIMMPLGGDLNGMYRFPRVGEKIIVAVEGISHYLMGYLPTKENPFSPKEGGKEKTEPFDKEAQVMRYKKTGKNTSDSTYSEIGFYSETTEWKEKEGSSNSKTDEDTKLPIVDKIKLSSTGDIETRAQNYNEVAAKRIGFFAGYGDNIEKRKAKQKTNLKGNKTDLDLDAFPVLPSDTADQDPAFFSGDIQMRAKKRIVLKAEDTIEIIAGPSIIRLDATGISLISRKTSVSSVNAWDSMITLSARDGLKMFGTKVDIGSAYKFSIGDSFGGNVMSLGGIMRITGGDIRLRSMCKAAYLVKGLAVSASFATNVGSMSKGIAQEVARENGQAAQDGALISNLPSYFSLSAGVVGTAVGAINGFNTMEAIPDAAGSMAVIMDFIITILGVVTIGLDKTVKEVKGNVGRSSLNMATAVVEYGLVITMFAIINKSNANFMHASSILMSFKGDLDISANAYKQTAITETRADSPVAGLQTNMITTIWNKFKEQAWWKIALEIFAAVAAGTAGGILGPYGYKNSSSANENIRKELEAL